MLKYWFYIKINNVFLNVKFYVVNHVNALLLMTIQKNQITYTCQPARILCNLSIICVTECGPQNEVPVKKGSAAVCGVERRRDRRQFGDHQGVEPAV